MFAVYSMHSDIIYNISDLEATLEAFKVSLRKKNEKRKKGNFYRANKRSTDVNTLADLEMKLNENKTISR